MVMITLEDFMGLYSGNAYITIEGYCKEKEYDYYLIPEESEEDFAGDNPNHYIPSCMGMEPWWEEAKNKIVSKFFVLDGERPELYICL